MTRYHINYEGKVYPCRAKVLKCPYSEAFHSDDKVELYYKLMGNKEAEVEPSKKGMRQLNSLNRLKSLYPLSKDIEESNSPMEVLVYTLKESLSRVINHDVEKDEDEWQLWAENAAEEVFDVLDSGYQVPGNVPVDIASMGKDLFHERRNGFPSERVKSTRNEIKMEERRALVNKSFSAYRDFKKDSLNRDNFRGTHRWLTRDFERFAHDLNTSRMITQPIFYGDLNKARESIKAMGSYELLSALDDYSITDKEIEQNVEEANYFKFNGRKDLTDEANDKLKEWYGRNREIYRNWKINTPKRVLLSMEIAEELDRRGIQRHDIAVAKMLSEENENEV